MSGWIVVGGEIESIGRNASVYIATLFHQLPVELKVICTTRKATRHAHDGELGLLRCPRYPGLKVLEHPADQTLSRYFHLGQFRLDF